MCISVHISELSHASQHVFYTSFVCKKCDSIAVDVNNINFFFLTELHYNAEQEIKFSILMQASLQAKQLMYRLLHRDPKNRLGSLEGANEIKRHPFFRGVNWALVRCMVNLETFQV